MRAAPLLPLSSLSTWTTISFPGLRQFLEDLGIFGVNTSFEISLNGRKPCLVLPKFTKAASRLGSTLEIIPLEELKKYAIDLS